MEGGSSGENGELWSCPLYVSACGKERVCVQFLIQYITCFTQFFGVVNSIRGYCADDIEALAD